MGEINWGGLPDLDLDFSKSRGGLPDLDLDPTRLDFCQDIIPLEISRPYLLSNPPLLNNFIAYLLLSPIPRHYQEWPKISQT